LTAEQSADDATFFVYFCPAAAPVVNISVGHIFAARVKANNVRLLHGLPALGTSRHFLFLLPPSLLVFGPT